MRRNVIFGERSSWAGTSSRFDLQLLPNGCQGAAAYTSYSLNPKDGATYFAKSATDLTYALTLGLAVWM